MLWAVYGVDKPGSAALRKERRPEHTAYLNQNSSMIFFSGPLQSDDAGTDIGSLWILKADSREAVQAFVDNEVFVRAGVFQNITVRRVRQGRFQPELAEPKQA